MLVDDKGLAKGVQYFDRVSGAERQVLGKVVIVGASTVDSTRILLNSTSDKHPNGLGNGSDVIGRYLCEQIRFHARGILPELAGTKTRNDRGIGGEHVYMPRFNHRPGRKRDYLRGFGAQFWNTGASAGGAHGGSELIPGLRRVAEEGDQTPASGVVRDPPVRRGPALRAQPRHRRSEAQGQIRRAAPGDRLPHRRQRAEDGRAHERHRRRDRQGGGGRADRYKRGDLDRNGSAIHEHGTCRMGTDPKRSALNGFNQMHEVKNVFVVDGSAFPNATEKNPTLTILALSWRATDYLGEQIKRGDL